MKREASSCACGILFGLGLSVSGMVNPQKILNFLDITGPWDPTLGVVFATALAVTALGYSWIRKQPRPYCDECFHIPERKDITPHLIAGSILFGVGWGTVGFCPGPAVAALAFGLPKGLIFVTAMLAGMFASRKF